MTHPLPLLTEDEARRGAPAVDDNGFGALRTDRGLLPLKAMDVRGRIDGLLAQVTVRQTFVNALAEPLEATYIFPLPDRAAVTRFRMEVAGRVVEGVLQERAQARREYDEAIAAGHRASIAEEERPGVFTLRVGNLPPGEEATVELALAGPLPFADGEVTFRFPMVVAPRYIPGVALSAPPVGDGTASDTDAVPDASRISPPVLLPGFPNPVRLSLEMDLHESTLPVEAIRSSLHAVVESRGEGYRRIWIRPGERLDRDFILRFRLGTEAIATGLSVHPDSNGAEGTFALTLVPPVTAAAATAPRDVVLVLDRSGSMQGWKMVAARRALARMVDTLGPADRFNVLAFDERISMPEGFPAAGLIEAADRNRFRAVEFLARVNARGGTEMAEPLDRAATILGEGASGRARILVLVTDGQVGNEDQLLRALGDRAKGTRIFTLGIDRAVNEAFLRRLAELGGDGGACEVVESEDRLDEVMDAVHRRIGTPVLTGLSLQGDGLPLVDDALVPERIPNLFASAPVLLLGRYRGTFPDRVRLSARDGAGRPWSEEVPARVRDNPAVASAWARGQVRKLEDRYVVRRGDPHELERSIVATSLEFGVLSRFTAYLAVDRSEVVNAGGEVRRITQPVEIPEGWEEPAGLTRAALCVDAPTMMRSMPQAAPPFVRLARRVEMDFLEQASAPTDGLRNYLPLGLPSSWRRRARPDPSKMAAACRDAREVLDELRGALAGDHAALVPALRGLVPKLQALVAAWKSIDRSGSAAVKLAEILKDLRRLLRRAAPAAEDVARVVAQLEPALAALAGPGVEPGPGPAPNPPRREGFWK